ncbi:MAG: LPS export ABC transporter permease LptG [Candidatus Manganitrophaceae bacterium]
MSILSRYLFKEYIKFFAVTLSSLFIVYLAIDFLEKIRKFSEWDAEFYWVIQYFLYKSPRMLFDIAPLAVLLATFITLGLLSRNNEVIAFKSCGVSLFRLTTPLLLFGGFLSGFLFLMNDSLIPSTFKKSKTIQQVNIEKKRPPGDLVQNKVWLRQNLRTLFNIEMIEPDRRKMHGINIYSLGNDFSLGEIVEAEALTYRDGNWHLSNGIRRFFLPDGTVRLARFDEEIFPMNKKPEDFKEMTLLPEETTRHHLQAYIDRLKADGLDSTRFRVDLLGRQAFPFVNFIMVLVGIPFALHDRRGGRVARGAGISLSLGLFYWIAFSATISLGRVHILPPWIAAWGANLLFFGIGSYLFLNIRQ